MNSYRTSHSAPSYGRLYAQTYEQGYYLYQWSLLERPLLEKTFAHLVSRGAVSCVDFACGTGRITAVAERYFERVVGVDVSASMLELARQTCSRATFIERDITKEEFGETFDACTAFRFFLNAEQGLREEALDAVRRCLNPGGYLVANIHVNSRSVLGFAYRIRNWVRGRNVANVMSYAEFDAMLKGSGFSIEHTSWYSFLPRVGWRIPWLAKHVMLPFDRVCLSMPVLRTGWSQSFLVVARKVR